MGCIAPSPPRLSAGTAALCTVAAAAAPLAPAALEVATQGA
jgi:hypothetical protein